MTDVTANITTRTGEPESDFEEMQVNLVNMVLAMCEEEGRDPEEYIVGLFMTLLYNTGACANCTVSLLMEAITDAGKQNLLHSCSDTADKGALN